MKRNNVLLVSAANGHSALRKWMGIAHHFHLQIVQNDEEAIEECHLEHYDVVLIDCTDESIDYRKLKAIIPILLDDTIILTYEGEDPESLTSRIEGVFSAKKYRRMLNMIMLDPDAGSQNELPQFSLN